MPITIKNFIISSVFINIIKVSNFERVIIYAIRYIIVPIACFQINADFRCNFRNKIILRTIKSILSLLVNTSIALIIRCSSITSFWTMFPLPITAKNLVLFPCVFFLWDFQVINCLYNSIMIYCFQNTLRC